MGIGGGIALIVLGLILATGVIQADIPGLNENALGVILILAGIAVIVLSQTFWRSRGVVGGTTVVEQPPTTGRVVRREVVERDVPPADGI
jgi:hypothetical protein